MSTFWLNSAGNFVDFKSRASTPVAMVGQIAVPMSMKTRCWAKC